MRYKVGDRVMTNENSVYFERMYNKTATKINKLYKVIDHPIYMPCEPTPYQPYKPNGIGNVAIDTMSAYIDDCIAQAVSDQPTEETKTFNIKGENEMNRILEVYYGRKRDKINAEFGKKCDKIKLADENYKVYNECVDKLVPIYEKTKQTFHDITKPLFSDETNKKLDELNLKREKELTKLDNEFDEINAQLSMCETYEQKQSVLKLYKVIDENGKLNA